MRLALVHDWLTGMRGGEKCLEVLCRRFPDADLYTLLHKPGVTSPGIEQMRIHTSFLNRLPGVSRYYRWTLPLMPRAIEALRLPDDLDLVVSLSHAVAKGVRPPSGVPHACYCFTPMRYAWDLRDDYFGAAAERRRGGLRRTIALPGRAARNALLDRIRDWDRAASDRVTHFVAISRTIQQRIRACYDRESNVIYPPVDTELYTPAEVVREEFYLCVSALVPYKRIDLAIAAANRLRRRLVVIGSGPEAKRLAALAGPTVSLLGWRSNEEIRDHYRRCKAFLFPGLEDFGIAPVEAQATGAPVIAYGRGGATETIVAGGADGSETGMFFEEQSPESLAAAIDSFESRAEPISAVAARRQAERFSTDRFERELIDYLNQVTSCGSPSSAPSPTTANSSMRPTRTAATNSSSSSRG